MTLLEGRPPRVRRVLRGFEQPRYTAFGADGRHAFVTDSGSGELAVIDVRRGRVIRRVDVGALARHVTIDPAGRRLWISLGSSAARSPSSTSREPRAAAAGARRAPAVPRPRRRLLAQRPACVAHRRARAGARGLSRRRPRADPAPACRPRAQHVTFGPSAAYVASGEGRSIHVHSLGDGRLLRSSRIPIGSYNVQRGAGLVLTPSLNTGHADAARPPRTRPGEPARRRGGARRLRRRLVAPRAARVDTRQVEPTHDAGPVKQDEASKQERALSAAPAGAAGQVLALQRSIGNRGVMALLRETDPRLTYTAAAKAEGKGLDAQQLPWRTPGKQEGGLERRGDPEQAHPGRRERGDVHRRGPVRGELGPGGRHHARSARHRDVRARDHAQRAGPVGGQVAGGRPAEDGEGRLPADLARDPGRRQRHGAPTATSR